MSTIFCTPLRLVGTTVASGYTAGSGTLTVADGSGFGSPSSSAPVRITCKRAGTILSILKVTGRSGNNLTITSAMDGTTDVNLLVGDTVEVLVSKGTITDIHTAINNLESTSLVGGEAGLTYVASTGTLSLTGVGTAHASKLVVKAGSSQSTTNLEEWQDINSAILAYVSSTGIIVANGTGVQVLGLSTPVNSAFSTSSTGGILATGTYYYRVAAVNAAGSTLASPQTSQSVVSGLTNTVTVNWTAVPGATSYNVYGRASGSQQLIANVPAPATSFIDDGTLAPGGALPGNPVGTKLVAKLWQNQTGNAIELQRYSDTQTLFSVAASGAVTSLGGYNLSNNSTFNSQDTLSYLLYPGSPSNLMRTNTSTNVILAIQGAPAHNVNLTEWKDSSSNVLASINQGGNLSIISTDNTTSQLLVKGAASQSASVKIVDIQTSAGATLLNVDKNGLVTIPNTLAITTGSGFNVSIAPSGLTMVSGTTAMGKLGSTTTRSGSNTLSLDGDATLGRSIFVGKTQGLELGNVITTSASSTPLTVKGASGQSVNLQEWQTNTGTVLASVSQTGTFTGNGSGLTHLTAANIDVGTVAIANGGTGQTTQAAGFNALSPLTTLGDVLYGGASGAGTRLGGNTSATKNFLAQTGNGTISAAPSWTTLVAADIPDLSTTYVLLAGKSGGQTVNGDTASGGNITINSTSHATLGTINFNGGLVQISDTGILHGKDGTGSNAAGTDLVLTGGRGTGSGTGGTILLKTVAGSAANQAASFASASSQTLSRASNAALQLGGTSWTIAFWVKLTTKAATAGLVSKDDTASNREYCVLYNQGTDRFYTAIDNGSAGKAVNANTFGSPSTGTWYFVVAWLDFPGQTINISVNNGTADSQALSSNVITNAAAAFVLGGRTAAASFLNGALDSVGVWKRVLTPTELTFLYNSGSGKVYNDLTSGYLTNLVAWYDFETLGADSAGTNTLTNNNTVTQVTGIAQQGASVQNTALERVRVTPAGLVGINQPTPTSQLHIASPAVGTVGQIIQGAISQSANLLELQDSAGLASLTYAINTGILTLTGVGTANSSTLVLKAGSAQATNLLEARDSSNNILTRINANGVIAFGSAGSIGSSVSGSSLLVQSDPQCIIINTHSGADRIIITRGTSNQVSDHQQWQSSNAAVMAAISASGVIVANGTGIQCLNLATPVNSTFSTATTGGTLAAGTYWYRVAAVNAAGTTLASTETSQVVPAGTSTNTVTVNWGAVAGADQYKVYGRTTGAELLMTTVAGTVLTFTDTGSITPSGALPGNPVGTKLVVKKWASQTGNSFELQRDSDTQTLFSVSATGSVATLAGYSVSNNASYSGYNGSYALYSASPHNLLVSAAAGNVILALKAAASQSGNLQEWQNSSGTPRAILGIPAVATDAFSFTMSASNSDYWTKQFFIRTASDGGLVGAASFFQLNANITSTLHASYIRSDQGIANTVIKIGYGNNLTSGGGLTDTYNPSTAVNYAHVTFMPAFTPSASSPSFASVQINPTINGTSTGTATSLAIAPKTNTLTGGTVNLIDAGGTSTDFFTGYTSVFKVGILGTTTVAINSSSAKGIIVKAAGSQSANLQEWQDNSNNPLSIVDPSGYAFPRDYVFFMAIGVPITTGTNVTNQMTIPRNGKIVKAFINAKTAPTGAALIVDINKNGTSIWASTQANRLQLAAAATTGTQTAFDTTTVAEGDLITIDIDQVGSTVAGQDVTVQLLVLLRNQ